MAPSLPVAFLIAGGETIEFLSSTSGKGGHNQELALSAALQMESDKSKEKTGRSLLHIFSMIFHAPKRHRHQRPWFL